MRKVLNLQQNVCGYKQIRTRVDGAPLTVSHYLFLNEAQRQF